MPSSPIERRDDTDVVASVAGSLSGEQVVAVEPCRVGGNNRVYRIQTRGGPFALKSYGSTELDERDRLGHEYDGLRFLKAAGIGSALPAALAVDRAAQCALYEWIEGAPVTDHGSAEIAAALALAAALHRARAAAGAASLPIATEAVLRLADLVDQIERRLARLAAVATGEADLVAFLDADLRPELARALARLAEWDAGSLLGPACRTLSPSDFGFHNALRRADGTLCFIDFEYFGWDDPAKLAADFLWHPAMQLSTMERRQFVRGATDVYGDDPAFVPRLEVCYPLYGIRWSLIMLNEFLPELWARRAFAGKGGDWGAAKREQLRKARANLEAVRSHREGQFA
jgi:Ser/Thr protein kinase RdoA (MazF antagonist)